MTKNGYSSITAAKEHLLEGNPLTRLEALVLFGTVSLPRLVREMRSKGWVIESQPISFAAAIKRMENHAKVEPPRNLPIRELQMTEYWVSR